MMIWNFLSLTSLAAAVHSGQTSLDFKTVQADGGRKNVFPGNENVLLEGPLPSCGTCVVSDKVSLIYPMGSPATANSILSAPPNIEVSQDLATLATLVKSIGQPNLANIPPTGQMPDLTMVELLRLKALAPNMPLPDLTQLNAIPHMGAEAIQQIKNTVAHVQLPDLHVFATVPHLSLQDLPPIPNLTIPTLVKLKVTLPNLDLPNLSNLHLDLPKVSVPNVPHVNLPNVSLADIRNLNLNIDHIPDVSLEFRHAVEQLNLKVPDLGIPDLVKIKVAVPDWINTVNAKIPDMNLPQLMPSIALPSMPAIHLPNIAVPNINMNLPEITLPNIQLPTVTLPDINLPSVPVPSIPSITLPGMPALPTVNVPSLPNFDFAPPVFLIGILGVVAGLASVLSMVGFSGGDCLKDPKMNYAGLQLCAMNTFSEASTAFDAMYQSSTLGARVLAGGKTAETALTRMQSLLSEPWGKTALEATGAKVTCTVLAAKESTPDYQRWQALSILSMLTGLPAAVNIDSVSSGSFGHLNIVMPQPSRLYRPDREIQLLDEGLATNEALWGGLFTSEETLQVKRLLGEF